MCESIKLLKKIIKIIVFIFLILFVLCIHIYKNSYRINTNWQPNNDPSYVRIYYDIATWPTLYQVEDFLNQSSDSTTFVLWARIQNLKEKLKDKKNIYFMSVGQNNTYKIFSPELEEYILKHPNSKYIIHTNNNFIHALFPYIIKIPKDNIVEINVYEDGAYAGFLHIKIYIMKNQELIIFCMNILEIVGKYFIFQMRIS